MGVQIVAGGSCHQVPFLCSEVTVVLGVYSDALLADGKVLDQIRTDLIRIFARRADGLMEAVANQDAELWVSFFGHPALKERHTCVFIIRGVLVAD